MLNRPGTFLHHEHDSWGAYLNNINRAQQAYMEMKIPRRMVSWMSAVDEAKLYVLEKEMQHYHGTSEKTEQHLKLINEQYLHIDEAKWQNMLVVIYDCQTKYETDKSKLNLTEWENVLDRADLFVKINSTSDRESTLYQEKGKFLDAKKEFERTHSFWNKARSLYGTLFACCSDKDEEEEVLKYPSGELEAPYTRLPR